MKRTPRTLRFWINRLPHWEVEDGRYFITIHLHGAIPAPGRHRLSLLRQQLCALPDKNAPDWLSLQRTIFSQMERWLDQARWNPKLQQPEVAAIVVEAIRHRQQRGDWELFEYVVMPTHIHLFGEIGGGGLQAVLEDFKRWTGHQAAKLPSIAGARFWQEDWFDHWSRSDEEDDRIIQYIRNNPVKAGLVKHYTEWRYGSWSK